MSQDLGLDVRAVEETLLGADAPFTRVEVAERAGVPLELAEELWQQLGFPHAADDDVAFSEADVEALALTRDLIDLGVLTPDSQAALVRTWGRSFARLAEWQVGLIARLAVEGDDPAARSSATSPRRCCPTSSGSRPTSGVDTSPARSAALLERAAARRHRSAVGFVDIVGYTGQSRQLTDPELVDWVELFENHLTSQRRRDRRPDHQDHRRRGALRHRRPRRPPSRSRSPPPSAAPTRRTRSRRSAPGSRTARS